jgi:hypothetical protein
MKIAAALKAIAQPQHAGASFLSVMTLAIAMTSGCALKAGGSSATSAQTGALACPAASQMPPSAARHALRDGCHISRGALSELLFQAKYNSSGWGYVYNRDGAGQLMRLVEKGAVTIDGGSVRFGNRLYTTREALDAASSM